MPNIKVGVPILLRGMRAVGWDQGLIGARYVVQGMGVSVAGHKRQPARGSSAETYLQSVVVGIVKIRYAVDESEVRERAIERSARLFAQGIDIARVAQSDRGRCISRAQCRLVDIFDADEFRAVVPYVGNLK